jgi:hypothetical protein
MATKPLKLNGSYVSGSGSANPETTPQWNPGADVHIAEAHTHKSPEALERYGLKRAAQSIADALAWEAWHEQNKA